MGIISLLVLVLVLVIGFFTKINIGFLAIAAGFILGHVLGIADSTIIAGFNTSLFVQFSGTALLFCAALSNGTMDILSRKLLKLTGNKGWLIPIVLGVVSFLIGITGVGNNTATMFVILGITLAIQLNMDPIAVACIVILTTNLSCNFSVAPMGIVIADIVKDSTYATGYTSALFINSIITCVVFGVILFIVCKPQNAKSALELEELKNVAPFNKNQYMTLVGIVIAMVGTLVFKFNVGLISAVVAIVLFVLKAGDDKAAIKIIPFGQFMTICGVSVLMKVIYAAGGIEIITDFLIAHMNKYTAVAIMGLASGILSWFSSAIGVTVPTMGPIALVVAEQFGGEVSFPALISAIAIGAYMAAFSPMSTSGGVILSNYSILTNPSGSETNKLFTRLFLTSVFAVLLNALLGLLGVYNIFA